MRQLKEDQPDLYRRVTSLRDGVRCGRAMDRTGAVVFCRAGRYRQLFLVDEAGEVVTRDIPRILNLLKCEPDTPAAPLPEGYNGLVMDVKRQFDAEVQARQAEQAHTLSLTSAQRYVQRALRLLHNQVDDPDLQAQIALLEEAFRRPDPRPAVRGELNRIKCEALSGMALLDALSQAYQVYGLDVDRSRREETHEENDDLPRIICSEGMSSGG